MKTIPFPESEGLDPVIVKLDVDDWGETVVIKQVDDAVIIPRKFVNEFVKQLKEVANDG